MQKNKKIGKMEKEKEYAKWAGYLSLNMLALGEEGAITIDDRP